MTQRKALVVLSGGQDSTTALHWAKRQFDVVTAVSFDYGQRHIRELSSASIISTLAQVPHEVIGCAHILKGRSPLTDPSAPLETYTDFATMDKTIGDRVELTFVPMRNALFLTIAANRAACADITNIVTGVCQADNANYPDCRRSFIEAQEEAINEALGTNTEGGNTIYIHTPLMDLSKSQGIQLATTLPGCMAALAHSHTCYAGAYPPCGKCHACVLRAHGFEEANLPDPLVLRAWRDKHLLDLPATANYGDDVLDNLNEVMCNEWGLV